MSEDEVQVRLRTAVREVHAIRARLQKMTVRGRLLMLLRRLRRRDRPPIPDLVADEK